MADISCVSMRIIRIIPEEGVGDFMPKITRVGALDGDRLDVELSNGNTILLYAKLIWELPGFEALREDDRVLYPKTDGNDLYWQGGPRLNIQEIITILSGD